MAPRHVKRGHRGQQEGTHLPYLIDAALRLRRSEQQGNWTTLAASRSSEERQESEQNSGNKAPSAPQRRKGGIQKPKKLVPRLLLGPKEGLKDCTTKKDDDAGGCTLALPALDERVLILYHSSLKRTWKLQQEQLHIDLPSSLLTQYGHEAIYAATQIQKLVRGVAARKEWRAFYCLRNQNAAARIQFALRRLLVYRNVLARLARKRDDRATRIQTWFRGQRCRDLLLYQHIRVIDQRIANFQRYIRGRRLWRIVMAILYQRRSEVATEIQRCYRGWKGRLRAVAIRFEQNRHVRHLLRESQIHARHPRCKGCDLESCSKDSLLACFMVRYVGLHDFRGAKTLCEDGLRLFPLSASFRFFYSVLLQAMCEDMETSMAYLKRAKEIGITSEELTECETHFFQPAHLMRPNDAQAFLDLAILCQSCDQLPRAETYYAKALTQAPQDYLIPGYLHRANMVDRLLLNYHRFCSIFNFRQVNVLVKEIFTSKKGKKVRLMVSKLNHFTAITPINDPSTCRINALYLTDDEVMGIIKQADEGDGESSKADAGNENLHFKEISNGGSSNMNSSMRQKSFRAAPKETPGKSPQSLLQKSTIVQLYQQEFAGLNVKPNELAQFSETRSKLRLTKPTAELLLGALAFIDPTTSLAESSILAGERQQIGHVLCKIMLIPFVLKSRQQHRSDIVRSNAAIDVQRVYRGFRLRAEVQREKLLNRIRQRQVDDMYRRLHDNFIIRELRRTSAVAIQRMYKGYAFRKLLRRWQHEAGQIQRVFRGYQGRLRAAAFREGSCTFVMAQRVFQRGVDISGRRVMLIVEKCGLSFRLDGYDLESCVTYHGFFSHSSSMALLCYLNWTYGETLCGREFTRKGDKVTIRSVSSVDRSTAECFVDCDGSASTRSTLRLTDCIQAINLRNFGAGGKDSPVLLLPMTVDDTPRLVEAITHRVILVPALRMATQELKTKAPAAFTISIQPPPTMHYTYQRQSIPQNTRKVFTASSSSASQFAYPVIGGLRGMSLGTKNFRKKCARHAVQFTRCRCILPIVSTSAHIEAIARALAAPPSSQS